MPKELTSAAHNSCSHRSGLWLGIRFPAFCAERRIAQLCCIGICMRARNPISTALRYPLWVAQLFTGAKSFLDNPVIGSQRLNRLGLHRGRVKSATAMAQWRRRRLARGVASAAPAQWRETFDRDGFVAISDFLPPEEFARLRAALLEHRAPAREMRQGDAITRRMAVNPQMLAAIPELRAFYDRKDLRGLFRYASSFAVEPLHYIQTILTHCGEGASRKDTSDPQQVLHADAFQPSMKAWFFLNDVGPDEAPFTYVPGSQRLTPARLAWEYRRSTTPPDQLDRLSARGSQRITVEELAELGLPGPSALAVKANTLVVADTFGFHARGTSTAPAARVELWSYSRRNPFLPWLGGDPLSLPGIAERRVDWLWAFRDKFKRHIGQPWLRAGVKRPLDGASAQSESPSR